MLSIISPAKIQNFKPQDKLTDYTQPIFLKEAEQLIYLLRTYSISELASLLNISTKLAEDSANSYFHWHTPFTPENAKQAILVYNGEVYRGLDASTLTNDDIHYLQNHLRMMTVFYGALRPLDLIQPYRLEAKAKILTESGEDLYSFWKPKINKEIAKALKASDNPNVILNLASNEYSKIIDRSKLKARVIEFDFLQYYPDNDRYKTITVYLKKARGLMLRFIAQNRISNPEDLRAFSSDGYWYSEKFSTEDKMVFVR